MIVRNPKKPEQIVETKLTEQQAVDICKTITSDFAQSLVKQLEKQALSPSQYFWLFKMAEENLPMRPLKLQSDLQQWISKTDLMQFKFKDLGKVLLYTRKECIDVVCAYRFCGKIVGDEFLFKKVCPESVKQEIYAFSCNPMEWMKNYGKETGFCCVCGRQLTNEVSVELGIGPICAQKF
jgi:hypothetical protein